MPKTKWINKKVVWFDWKIYHGFFPKKTGIVIAETDDECLVQFSFFKKTWCFKDHAEKLACTKNIVGFCKLIKQDAKDN